MDGKDPRRCYAEPLGGCGGGLSREHYFTAAIFGKGGTVRTDGLFNMPDREIPLGSAGAKILCRDHNSSLSPIDEEAKQLSRFIQELHSPSPSPDIRCVNGPLIERWLIKAACGIWAAGHVNGKKVRITEQLLRYLFGIEPIPAPLGLHSLAPAELASDKRLQFKFTPVFASHPDLGTVPTAAFISLHGLPFLLNLGGPPVEGCLPRLNPDVSFADFDLSRAKATRRPTHVTFGISNFGTQRVIVFDGWPSEASQRAR